MSVAKRGRPPHISAHDRKRHHSLRPESAGAAGRGAQRKQGPARLLGKAEAQRRAGSLPGGRRQRLLLRVRPQDAAPRSEEHTSELQSLMRISYAVFSLKKKNTNTHINTKQ